MSTSFTSKSSYSNIGQISFYVNTSDKGKTNLTVEVCPNEDFSSDVTTVQATAVMNGGGLPTNVANNNQYYQETYTLASRVSGYVRVIVSEASGSSSKTIIVGNIVITYSASGKTTLTGAWSNSSPSFAVGSAATIPTFSVTGGGTLGADYTVAYTKTDDSGIVTLTGGNGAISAINTAAAATATVTATVTIVNTTTYEMATTSYDCAISVVAATKYTTPTITEKNGTVQITSPDDILVSQIKYSLDDGDSWNDYTIPFNLTTAKTVKAKVVAGADPSHADSDVASEDCNAIPAALAGSQSITIFYDADKWTKSASQDGSSTNDTWTGKTDTYLEGYSIVLDNVGKTGSNIKELSSGSAINSNSTIKGSNGRTLTFTLPSGVKVNRITVYSYTNGDDDNFYASGWKFNGSAADMIGLSLRDVARNDGKSKCNASNPDVRVFSFAEPLEGTFTFVNTGYQQCFYMVLDYNVSISTLSGRNYASYVTSQKLDFASADGITAYIATGLNGGSDAVVLQEVDVVPAGEPIIVKTDTKGATVNVPVTTADASSTTGNALVAGDGTTAWNGTDGYTYYYIASDQFHKATSGTLKSGKAYLKVANGDVPAPVLNFAFGDVTGINEVQGSGFKVNGYYDLQGRKVVQPTKGLYIVNGKKIVIK